MQIDRMTKGLVAMTPTDQQGQQPETGLTAGSGGRLSPKGLSDYRLREGAGWSERGTPTHLPSTQFSATGLWYFNI